MILPDMETDMAILSKKCGSLELLQAECISAPHAFTTRSGGVSTGYLSSLNLGTSRGDSKENVVENYRILGQALGFAPEDVVLSHQTHSDIIRVVTKNDRGTGLLKAPFPPCDGLITGDPGVALMIFTADCTPLLAYDPVTGAVGAAHAGWKGTAQDIGGKLIRAMADNFGCDPGNIRAAVGPNIGQCCFQTDRDVPDALIQTYGDEILPFILKKGEKFYPDLKRINALALRRAGVNTIDISTECTFCQCDRFWSHRKVGSSRGSQGAIILCKEDSR